MQCPVRKLDVMRKRPRSALAMSVARRVWLPKRARSCPARVTEAGDGKHVIGSAWHDLLLPYMVDNRLPEDTLFLVFEPDYRTYGEDLEAKELANSSLIAL